MIIILFITVGLILISSKFQHRGAGCIIRNKQGELVLAVAYNLNKSDKFYRDQINNVAVAEAIAWRNGLILAKLNNVH